MLTCGGGGMQHKSSSELGHDQDFRKKACAQIDQGIAKIITSVDVVHFLIIFSWLVLNRHVAYSWNHFELLVL